jgi:hypothetical protein
MRPRPVAGTRLVAAVALVVLVSWPARPGAHEIPADVLIQAFVKPEGRQLRLLVRVPLATVRDVLFPETQAGFLDLDGIEPQLLDAARLWITPAVSVYADGVRVGEPRLVSARLSLPSDRSFGAYDDALRHMSADPLPPGTTLVWNQALLDVLMHFPIESDRARFAIEPLWARLGIRVSTVLRFLPPDGPERAFFYAGDPGRVELDPSWRHAAWMFVTLGFEHITGGVDHLLFLLCLVAPFRRVRSLVLIVTAFTVAHSITLISAALGGVPDRLWFPPLIETLIAISIVYMAIENIVMGAAGPLGAGAVRRRWALTFAFGLVHGFGFSFALGESLQFAGSHLATSLLMFNLGVELGQLAVLAVLIPALALLFRYVVAERVGVIIISALVAHTAWHWMTERGAILGEYAWTTDDVRLLASAVRWALLVVSGAAVVWLIRDVAARKSEVRRQKSEVREAGSRK